MPGITGAGGYKEYYAEKSAGQKGFWGENRIVKQLNDPTSFAVGGYWWATSDHYTTMKYITDAK